MKVTDRSRRTDNQASVSRERLVVSDAFVLRGEIDVSIADDLEFGIEAWLESGSAPIIDMIDVTFIDSSLLNMLARITGNQRVTLRNLAPPTKRL